MNDTVLLTIAAFFTFVAAMGVWFAPSRKDSVRREEVEELLAAQREEFRSAVNDAVTAINKTHDDSTELARELSSRVIRVHEQTRDELSASVAAVQASQNTLVSDNLRIQDESQKKMMESIEQVSARIDRAVENVQSGLLDLARQHNEAKAQTAMQFCEALIGSLGNLRNQIAASIAAPGEQELLTTEAREQEHSAADEVEVPLDSPATEPAKNVESESGAPPSADDRIAFS